MAHEQDSVLLKPLKSGVGIAPAESTAAAGESGETGCPIKRVLGNDGLRCGRRFHAAPEGIDEKPVCLMHSKDPQKQSGPLFDAFRLEFERILKGAGEEEAHFEYFVFPYIDFGGRCFQAVCLFDFATFTQGANFFYAVFTQRASFSGATFTQGADFRLATFKQRANFSHATFAQDADFWGATFTDCASFSYAIFKQAVEFEDTEFHGIAEWVGSRFFDRVEFRGTEFKPQVLGEPSAVFALARFSKPGEAVFDNVDLSRALFLNCDVSQFFFPSSVQWATRDGNRGLAVFEETILLEQMHGQGLQRDGQRDYRAVAQIYQQLKKSYDSRLDYWTANDFHFGEMEMKRLATPTGGCLLGLRRWWHRNLNLVAWYRRASDYGNSYAKPMLWLLGILLLFAVLFPLPEAGLKPGSSPVETYISEWRTGQTVRQNLISEVRLGTC